MDPKTQELLENLKSVIGMPALNNIMVYALLELLIDKGLIKDDELEKAINNEAVKYTQGAIEVLQGKA